FGTRLGETRSSFDHHQTTWLAEDSIAQRDRSACLKQGRLRVRLRGTQGSDARSRCMDKPKILVRASPEGFRWKVISDGETVASGTAKTEFEARNAANEIAGRIANEPMEGP